MRSLLLGVQSFQGILNCLLIPVKLLEVYLQICRTPNQNEKKNHPERLIYMTETGIRVRSKSELLIANALFQKGIPFSYEAVLALGGKNREPDFTIYRPSDGKLFIWEHFGLMDENVYLQTTNEKIAFYARYGFHPFKNLIFTYEEDIQNPAHIHAIINMFFSR